MVQLNIPNYLLVIRSSFFSVLYYGFSGIDHILIRSMILSVNGDSKKYICEIRGLLQNSNKKTRF